VKQLTKSVEIVEAKQFFPSFDGTSFSFNKNCLFILVKLEHKAEPLMQNVLTFLSEKKAHLA
jgi:hypothetical protein